MLTEQIAGWMSPTELQVLREAAASLPEDCIWVEVGVWHGRSAHAVALALPRNATLYLVDDYRGVEGYDAAQAERQCANTIADIAEKRPQLKIERWKLSSISAAAKFKALGLRANIAFIDADHSHPAITKDIAAWGPLADVLMGHDYDSEPGVTQAVDATYPNRVVHPYTSIWDTRNQHQMV